MRDEPEGRSTPDAGSLGEPVSVVEVFMRASRTSCAVMALLCVCSAPIHLVQGRGVSTITVRLDNVTNEPYRNHLSYLKDLAPEMGRNFKVLYNVTF
jgi:hypothetical protein